MSFHVSNTTSSAAEHILAEVEQGLPNGLLPVAIFNDPDLHRIELERVFARNWVFVGHESEVPTPGDYVLRYIGEDPFVFVRDEEGQLRVIWDSCRHRGAQICRSEKGNASHFRCPYHGWTYKNTGELAGVPAYKQAYDGLDRSKFGLHQAPHVASYHGLVFACLDPAAPSFDEYLGGARWYLDFFFGVHEGGMEVIGEPHRWVIDSNWKVGADNFSGDDYHTLFLHKSMWDIGAIQIPTHEMSHGYHVQIGNGHTIDMQMGPDPDLTGVEYMLYPEDVVKNMKLDDLSPDQRRLLRQGMVNVGAIFPNFSHLALPMTHDPKGVPPTPVRTVRTWQPKGPNQMEAWSWVLVPKQASEEFKERSYNVMMGTFSSSGIFEQDDTEPWMSITRSAGSITGRVLGAQLNWQMGLEGIGSARPVDDWVGPGLCYSPRYEEGAQRSWWRRWADDMALAPVGAV